MSLPIDGELDTFEFDPNNDLGWEGIAEVLLENRDDDNYIRINPISSNFSFSERIVSTSDRDAVTSLNYVGSAGNSRRSVEFEEFLRSPEARELFEGSPARPSNGSKDTTRKTKREDVYSSSSIYDDENADGIKAMRGGSLGRVIASSVAAGSLVDQQNELERQRSSSLQSYNNAYLAASQAGLEEERKAIMVQFFQKLNRCDVSGLVKIIRNCHEVCVLSTPDVSEPIIGRSDIMMLLSLFIEAYPDGIWTPGAITASSADTISCTYRFMGTRVFDHPINILYRQIQTHIGSILAASSNHRLEIATGMDAEKLVSEVAEGAVPTDTYHQEQIHQREMDAEEEEQQVISIHYPSQPHGKLNLPTLPIASSSSSSSSQKASQNPPTYSASSFQQPPVPPLVRQTSPRLGTIVPGPTDSHASFQRPPVTTVPRLGGILPDTHAHSNNTMHSGPYAHFLEEASLGHKQHHSGFDGSNHSSSNNLQGHDDADNGAIMFRRRSRSLREVKTIESAVLQEGPTTYRRRLEFLFNVDTAEISHIVFTNLL